MFCASCVRNVHVSVSVHAHTFFWRSEVKCLLWSLSTLLLKRVSQWTQSSLIWLVQLVSATPNVGVTDLCSYPRSLFFSFTHLFNMNFEDTNLGLHVCVGGTLPMQSFPNSGPRLLYLWSNAFIFFSPTVTHYKYLLSKPPKDDKLELHLWIWSFILLMAHRAINDLIIFTSYNGNYPVKFQEKTAHTLSANKIGGNQKDFPKEY